MFRPSSARKLQWVLNGFVELLRRLFEKSRDRGRLLLGVVTDVFYMLPPASDFGGRATRDDKAGKLTCRICLNWICHRQS